MSDVDHRNSHINMDYDLFIVDGKTYDLREWIQKHPGGSTWFARSNGRDISAAVHAYHRDPEKLRRILAKYEVQAPAKEAQNPTLNVPTFILPPEFDARKDTPVYDWASPNGLLRTLQKTVNTDAMRRRLRRADRLFDLVGGSILAAHLIMMFVGVPRDWLPTWAFVLFFVITRTSMASIGHYHCHRKKDGIADWGDALFDMQYVGATVILFDGHVLGHHLYTNSRADPKRTVFTGMLDLPVLWRIPVYTLQKFGQFLTGHLVRWFLFNQEPHLKGAAWNPLKHVEFLFMRILLIAELLVCWRTGHLGMWILQFVLCVWWNLFLIVSSHDFEESRTKADLSPGQDWGAFQVKNSFDLSVVNNRYLDCFLTAGLGTHRIHHVLPGQRSGFSNILTEESLRRACEQFDIPWPAARNFVTERLPFLFKHYVFAPKRGAGATSMDGSGPLAFLRDHFSWSGSRHMFRFVVDGFKGQGSI